MDLVDEEEFVSVAQEVINGNLIVEIIGRLEIDYHPEVFSRREGTFMDEALKYAIDHEWNLNDLTLVHSPSRSETGIRRGVFVMKSWSAFKTALLKGLKMKAFL